MHRRPHMMGQPVASSDRGAHTPSPASPFHAGEWKAQEAAGVRTQADRLTAMFRDALPPAAIEFLGGERMVVATTLDPEGRPHPSLMLGPDLLHANDPQRLVLSVPPVWQERLARHLDHPAPIGLLVVDAATRRRMRVNGRAVMHAKGRVAIDTEAVYSNCPRHIRPRRPMSRPVSEAAPKIETLAALGSEHQTWAAEADTFFLASHHARAGADASHRGGDPGVLQLDGDVLSFPDYAGNNLYNTLGNLLEDPRIGVAIPDFERGRILEIAGRARIAWQDDAGAPDTPKIKVIKARVEVDIEAAWQVDGAFAAPWVLV